MQKLQDLDRHADVGTTGTETRPTHDPVEAGRTASRQRLLALVKDRKTEARMIDRLTARIMDYESRALAALDDGNDVRSAEAAHSIVYLEKIRQTHLHKLDRLERSISWLKRGLASSGYEMAEEASVYHSKGVQPTIHETTADDVLLRFKMIDVFNDTDARIFG